MISYVTPVIPAKPNHSQNVFTHPPPSMLLLCRSNANNISRHDASHNPLGTRRHIVEGPSRDSAASHMRQLLFFYLHRCDAKQRAWAAGIAVHKNQPVVWSNSVAGSRLNSARKGESGCWSVTRTIFVEDMGLYTVKGPMCRIAWLPACPAGFLKSQAAQDGS